MSNFLERIHVKCAVFCRGVFPQTGEQGLFALRNLMKSHLTISAQLRNMRLHCLAPALRRSQAYSSEEQLYCNARLQRKENRDLAAGYIPNVQERAPALPRAVSLFQCLSGVRAHSVAHFGWC